MDGNSSSNASSNSLLSERDSMFGDPQNGPDGAGMMDMGEYEEDDDNEKRGKNGQPKAKKRRKYINKACDNCRTRHSRCDGKEPCGPCLKKGFQCGYSAPPSRRGPVSERQLQDLISSLTKQIESEKKMKKDWKEKFIQKVVLLPLFRTFIKNSGVLVLIIGGGGNIPSTAGAWLQSW